jgi:transposase
MATNYERGLFNDYQKLMKDFKECMSEVKSLREEVKKLKDIIVQKDIKIEKLELEVKRLKNNKSKNSSNSSNSSSKDGHNKVKNSRKKTGKKPGGQNGHKGTTSSIDKIENLISSGNVEVEEIKVNESTDSTVIPKIRYVHDIIISNVIKKYIYYPDADGNYNIPSEQHNLVTYGNNIKSISMLLAHKANTSMDQIQYFLEMITNDAVKLSKGTLVNWTNCLAGNLKSLIDEIEEFLLDSNIVHTDESPINVNGKTFQLHNYSNKNYTLQYVREKRTKEAIADIGFLTSFLGTLIHDHNTVQYNYGSKHGECNAHILRYLQGVTDFTTHGWAENMSNLLKEILHQKNIQLENEIDSFDDEALKNFSNKYDKVLKEASKEYQTDYNKNPYKDDERKLITRLEKYKENHLLFMYDFEVPFTNNIAEADIRPSKRKLNTGIFRSQIGAESFIKIRSFISTFQKRGLDVFEGIVKCFRDGSLSLA